MFLQEVHLWIRVVKLIYDVAIKWPCDVAVIRARSHRETFVIDCFGMVIIS